MPCIWLGHIGRIMWVWRECIGEYRLSPERWGQYHPEPWRLEMGEQYGPTAVGRRSVLYPNLQPTGEGGIAPNLEGRRRYSPNMSEPDSQYLHCYLMNWSQQKLVNDFCAFKYSWVLPCEQQWVPNFTSKVKLVDLQQLNCENLNRFNSDIRFPICKLHILQETCIVEYVVVCRS